MKGELGEFTERVAVGHPNQRAYRRWLGHAAGIPACEKKCRAGPARALLRDATWRGRGRHFDVTTELLRGMSTKEEAVEKSGFPLGKIEVQRDFRGNELLRHRSHGEKAVYRKVSRRQVVPGLGCYVAGNPRSKNQILDACSASVIQHRHCGKDSNHLRMEGRCLK